MRRTVLALALTALLTGCAGDNAMSDANRPAAPGDRVSSQPPVPGNPGAYPAPGVPDTISPPPPANMPPVVPDPDNPDLDIVPIQVDKVDVQILESAPPQVTAHVTGILGDGCSKFKEIKQSRNGNVIELSITSTHPSEAACTAIAVGYDEVIRLEGEFAPGEYTLRVNGVEQTFKI